MTEGLESEPVQEDLKGFGESVLGIKGQHSELEAGLVTAVQGGFSSNRKPAICGPAEPKDRVQGNKVTGN